MHAQLMVCDWQARTLTPDPVNGRPVGRVRLSALVTGRGFKVIAQNGADRTDAWLDAFNIPRPRG